MSPGARQPGRLRRRDVVVFTLVFLGVFGAALIHTARQPRVYEAVGMFSFFEAVEVERQRVADGLPRSDGWAATRAAAETQLVGKVVKRLSRKDRDPLLGTRAATAAHDEGAIEKRLWVNVRMVFDEEAKTLTLRFRHTDRFFSARVARLLCDEMTALVARLWIYKILREAELLHDRARKQEKRVEALNDAMSAYREKRIEKNEAPFEADAYYRALEQERVSEQELLDRLIGRMRESTLMIGPVAYYWSLVERPEVAEEQEYLRGPIVVRLVWGFALAVIAGLTGVCVMRKAGNVR